MDDYKDLVLFEDFESDNTDTDIDFNTDELRTVDYVKRLDKKGIPAWQIKEEVAKKKPDHTWIIKSVLGTVRSETGTMYITSKEMPGLRFLDGIKRPFFIALGLSCLCLTAGFYIGLAKNLKSDSAFQSDHIQKSWRD